jgi:hypothetical protein
MLVFLLGEKQRYKTQGEELLENICDRYCLRSDVDYTTYYAYWAPVPSRVDDRPRDNRRKELMDYWLGTFSNPVIIGFGWVSCDLLFRVGKSKMNSRIGCKWIVEGYDNPERRAWLTYDPNAALFDPNLVCDIAGTIVTAAKEDGHTIRINKSVKPYNWEKFL